MHRSYTVNSQFYQFIASMSIDMLTFWNRSGTPLTNLIADSFLVNLFLRTEMYLVFLEVFGVDRSTTSIGQTKQNSHLKAGIIMTPKTYMRQMTGSQSF